MHSSAEFKKTNPNPFVAELRFQCLNYPVLKYQKSLVLQPEHKAVPPGRPRRLSWDNTKTKPVFPGVPSLKGIFFWQRWKI